MQSAAQRKKKVENKGWGHTNENGTNKGAKRERDERAVKKEGRRWVGSAKAGGWWCKGRRVVVQRQAGGKSNGTAQGRGHEQWDGVNEVEQRRARATGRQ